MTCNKCTHVRCCHHLLQDERGYDEHTETYHNDMETRCEDFDPQSKYGISNVKIDKLYLDPDKKLKAIVSVRAGYFAVHGIRVFEEDKGIFVTMPTLKSKGEQRNTQYLEVCHALNKESREELVSLVIAAYEEAVKKAQN